MGSARKCHAVIFFLASYSLVVELQKPLDRQTSARVRAELAAPLTVDHKPWLVQNAFFLLSLLASKLILRKCPHFLNGAAYRSTHQKQRRFAFSAYSRIILSSWVCRRAKARGCYEERDSGTWPESREVTPKHDGHYPARS